MSDRRCSEEFKAEAVKQVRERGYFVQEVVRRIGGSPQSLYVWVQRPRGGQATGEMDAVRRENSENATFTLSAN
jgi:transposase